MELCQVGSPGCGKRSEFADGEWCVAKDWESVGSAAPSEKLWKARLRTDKKDYAQALDKRGRMDAHIAAFTSLGPGGSGSISERAMGGSKRRSEVEAMTRVTTAEARDFQGVFVVVIEGERLGPQVGEANFGAFGGCAPKIRARNLANASIPWPCFDFKGWVQNLNEYTATAVMVEEAQTEAVATKAVTSGYLVALLDKKLDLKIVQERCWYLQQIRDR
ncbi:unnamed protein product [Symbiodinium sp. KB8]|nr:unnamed protein product [Symbiodinium sp. KB8]